ncbi:MAG: putative addiction module antidote protein [Verrucomicrobia bacterium]|nr:putative addiction module antidote protein [Verrucomicrobiota bacterium]
MVKVKNYKEHLLERLQDSEEAAEYLNAALHDDDPHAFLLALRDITEAQGGMGCLAKQSALNRENFYRTLSIRGNPRFFNLLAVLDAFGLELSIQARPSKETETGSSLIKTCHSQMKCASESK